MEVLGNYATAKENIGHLSLAPVTQKVHITLPAAYFGKLKQAISISLESKLSQYSTKFQGVPVAFDNKNVKLLSNLGNMIADQSEVHFDVQVDFVVFQPKIGETLEGVVNKLMNTTRPRFGCLVHGFFYVAVNCTADEMPEVGDKVWFTVTSLENDGNGYLQIIGQFQRAEKQLMTSSSSVEDEKPIVTSSATDDVVVDKVEPSGGADESAPFPVKEAVTATVIKQESGSNTTLTEDTETPSKSKKSKHKKKDKKEKKSKKHKKDDSKVAVVDDNDFSSPSSKRTKIG